MPAPLTSANSARPGSLDAPVPGKDGQAALDAFLAQKQAPSAPAAQAQPSAAPAGDPGAALDQFQQQAAQNPNAGPGVAGKTLDAAGRVLDYPGGFMRAGLADVASRIVDPNSAANSVVTPEDLKKAAVGKGPSSEEYLRRMGVPEGGSLTFGGSKVTSRDVAGLALDVATDPLTAVAKLIKGAPYIAKLLEVPGKATEALGEAVYRSGVSKIDAKLAEKGTAPLSGVLLDAGAPVGTTKTIADKVSQMTETMGKIRQGLYDKATELGVTIDASYPLKRAEAVLENFKTNPALRAGVDDLQKLLDGYKAEGKVSIDRMSEWKTSLYDSLPASAFQGEKLKGTAKMFKAALANDFRDAIVQAGNAGEKGLGDAIEHTNSKWGTLLEAAQPLQKQANAPSTSKLGLMIDGALLASGQGYAFAGKKAVELANTTAARTAVGKALMEVGKTDIINRLTRQATAEAGRPPVPLLDEAPAE